MTTPEQLREIEISVSSDANPDDPGDRDHVEISLTAAMWHHLGDESVTDREFHAAAIETAGILARLALHANGWVALGAQRHNCLRWLHRVDNIYYTPYATGCHVGMSTSVLRPGRDLGDTPTVWLTVPASECDDWLELAADWLRVIGSDLDDMTAADDDEPSNHDTTTTTTHDEHPSESAGPATVRPDETVSEKVGFPDTWGTPPAEQGSPERKAWFLDAVQREARGEFT